MTIYRYATERTVDQETGLITYTFVDFPNTFGRGQTEDEAEANTKAVLKGLIVSATEDNPLPPASQCKWNQFLIVVDDEDEAIVAAAPAPEPAGEPEAAADESQPGGEAASADETPATKG